MIAYLQGTLLETRPEGCTILTPGGVGYVLNIPLPLLQQLPKPGQEIALHVHTVVKEDALELFGFSGKEELQTFRQLIAVSKLGPKTALAIISTFSPEQLQDIFLAEDTATLSRVPGIGPKSAKRIIWELKESFSLEPAALGQKANLQDIKQSSRFADALAGLLNLGYAEHEVRPVLKQLLQEDSDLMLEELIRSVLKTISKSRSGH